jgi:hypothetical protein
MLRLAVIGLQRCAPILRAQLENFMFASSSMSQSRGLAEPRVGWHARWLRWPTFGRPARVEAIRRSMLLQLSLVEPGGACEALAARIRAADDVDALWALRSEWMQVLSDAQGLLVARQRLSDLSFMFSGLLQRAEQARADIDEDPAQIPPGHAAHHGRRR